MPAPAGHEARLGVVLGWLRRNRTSMLMVVAVICTLTVIAAVVHASASRKDRGGARRSPRRRN